MANKAKPSITTSIGPDKTFPDSVLEAIGNCEERCFPGDTFEFKYLKEPKYGLTVIDIKAVQIPDYDERDEDLYGDCDTQLLLKLHADLKSYPAEKKNEVSKNLEDTIKKYITPEGMEEDWFKILDITVEKTNETYHEVVVSFICELYFLGDENFDIVSSQFTDAIWNKRMEDVISEGVCYLHGNVPADLRSDLRKHLDDLATNTSIDYHPNSNDIVRDLVHPALYPYIKGTSKLNVALDTICDSSVSHDFWGRPYENSKYQWLPTPFNITEEGKCEILEYINNLDRDKFSDLYTDLEKLFEVFLPYFEEVWSYVNAMKFFKGENDENYDDDFYNPKYDFQKEKVSFAGKELQVIVKIVEYTLQPGQAYEGVWHAEGMSHENIVMTGIYFIDRDQDIAGGDLRFKRAFSMFERQKIFSGVAQERPAVVNDFASDGFIPLGHFPTSEGYMLVFPNCHIHKIAKMINESNSKSSSRRIVVFFVINPNQRIVSTREVPKQQDRFSLRNAKKYRLELMAERKYDKEKLNVRDIELCEH